MNVIITMTQFTDFISNAEQQYQYGWVYISLILLSFCVNLWFVLLDNINFFRLLIIMIYNNRKNLKHKIMDLLKKKGILEISDSKLNN